MVIIKLIVHTTNGKYCKLINVQFNARWRLMSPTAPVVPFSNLLATVFKKRNSFLKRKSREWCNWCVLCRRINRESILSLCKPRTLCKGFNQNPIKKKNILTLGRWSRKCQNTNSLPGFRLQSDIIVPPQQLSANVTRFYMNDITLQKFWKSAHETFFEWNSLSDKKKKKSFC